MGQLEGKTALMMGASAARGVAHTTTAAFLICALALSVHAGRKCRVATNRGVCTVTISNFGKVKDHYFRGAQPDEDQYKELAAIGVKTVIDLRDDAKRFAKSGAEQVGLRYINFPLGDKEFPAADAAQGFLKIVNDSRNWPVYVYCAGGRHRTGAMTAVNRMTMDGWDIECAYREMKEYGFYTRRGHKAMKEYVYDYYRNLQADREGALTRELGSWPRLRIGELLMKTFRYTDGGIHARDYRGVPKTLDLVMCANQETKIILLVASISQQRLSESAIDATRQDSFPASDLPYWALGIACWTYPFDRGLE
jgi:protein tyrosine phosphatase (PTP) superfamily phosphohydrolase (DUF442 family)